MLQQLDFRDSGFLWFPGPDFGFRAISGPAPGPYLIRALSRGEQLGSKNKKYFFIGVSRVDFENEIFKRKFLFWGRAFGGFWADFGIRPTQRWPVARGEQLGSKNFGLSPNIVFRMESDFFF